MERDPDVENWGKNYNGNINRTKGNFLGCRVENT